MLVTDILQQQGIQLINDIRANLGSTGTNATGETSNSLKFEIKENGPRVKFTLLGRRFFRTVETGRRPTPSKKPSREMITNITAWVEARGLDIKSVWAIATKIQQRGTLLWFKGGREDIIEPAVDDFINNVMNDLANKGADEVVLKVREWSK